jgi:transcription termination factor Rho
MDRSALARKPMTELRDIAAHLQMRGYQRLRKAELIEAIVGGSAPAGEAGDPDRGDEAAAAAGAGEAPATARKVLPPGGAVVPPPPAAEQAPTGAAEDGPDPAAGDGGAASAPPADAAPAQLALTADGEDEGEGGGVGAPAEAGPAATAVGDPEPPADGDGEGEDPARRRSRRDRRKRNRDRQDGDADRAEPAPAGERAPDRAEQPAAPAPRHERGRGGEPAAAAQPAGQGGGQGPAAEPGEVRAGVLDILPEGYGFLRTTGYLPGERDVYVSQGQIRKHGLRKGDVVQGPIRQQRSNEKVPALHHVQKVNGEPLEDGHVPARTPFEELPIAPAPARVDLLAGDDPPASARLLQRLAPIGLGQRVVVVAPPRAGEDRLVRELADALLDGVPDAHLMAVLVDQRPEVVAEAQREPAGEVIASAFDQPAEDHVQIAELAFERARRMVELGHDVVVVVDSMTRLARAHGVVVSGSGRSIAPGVEAASLYPAKRMLAAARRIEGGGSLTVLAVLSAGTGSALDEVVLQELRRTAATEVVLDEQLVRRRVWPPISVRDSDTRDEAALLDEAERADALALRRELEDLAPADATVAALERLGEVVGG